MLAPSPIRKSVQDILNAADDATPAMRAAMRQALEAMRAAVPDLESLLTAGRVDDVIRAAQVTIPPEVLDQIRRATQQAAQATASLEAATFGINLNLVNPQIIRWAERFAAEQITSINRTTRRALQASIVEALQQGVHPRVLAKHIRTLVGLTPRHSRAVDRLFLSMIQAEVTESHALRIAGRKANQLLRWRAETIARTEMIRAANQGTQITWDTAIDNGLLAPAAQKVWIATNDTRTDTVCRDLDGTVVPVGSEFPGGYMSPPRHPRCRCAMGIESV